MRLNRRLVFTFIAFTLVVISGIIYVVSTQNSYWSGVFSALFAILGVLSGLSQWLLPISSSEGSTKPTATIDNWQQTTSQATPQQQLSTQPDWRAWMRVLTSGLFETMNVYLLWMIVFGGAFIMLGIYGFLWVLGFPVDFNNFDRAKILLWVFVSFTIWLMCYIYFVGGRIEEERKDTSKNPPSSKL